MAGNRGLAHIGTISSHGGVVITGAVNVMVCGRLASMQFDLHVCPRKKHGVTPIVTASETVFTNGRRNARQFDVCGCGAVLLIVCSTVGGN